MNLDGTPELDGGNLGLGLIVGTVTAVVFGLGGFYLAFDSNGFQGWVLFFVVPLVTGFATALVARGRNVALASVIMGLLFCTTILLVLGLEGFVCVIMSAPLIAGGLTLGALFGWLTRKYYLDKAKSGRLMTFLMLLILPLFVMGANSAEKPTRSPREQTVTDTLVVAASEEAVWKQLEGMDKITATKTFLMKIGLPVPVSCAMEGTGVGAKRTCYFEHGFIEERVTEWNFPNSMKFDVVAAEVPGRPWLSFKDASYEIRRANGQTTITRRTTIVSRLSPAWYWGRLEAHGVHSEHNYLFEALDKNLKEAK